MQCAKKCLDTKLWQPQGVQLWQVILDSAFVLSAVCFSQVRCPNVLVTAGACSLWALAPGGHKVVARGSCPTFFRRRASGIKLLAQERQHHTGRKDPSNRVGSAAPALVPAVRVQSAPECARPRATRQHGGKLARSATLVPLRLGQGWPV